MTAIVKSTKPSNTNYILKEVDLLAESLRKAEDLLECGYAEFGSLLVVVSQDELWRQTEHKTFDAYVRGLGARYDLGRTQIYKCYGVVRELSPYLSTEQLNQIGISKAQELKSATKRSGVGPSEEIVAEAIKKETKIDDIRKLLFAEGNPAPENKGVWYPTEGFWVTEEEKQILDDADAAAWRTDPVVQETIPAWARKKESRLRQAMNFLADHGEETV